MIYPTNLQATCQLRFFIKKGECEVAWTPTLAVLQYKPFDYCWLSFFIQFTTN